MIAFSVCGQLLYGAAETERAGAQVCQIIYTIAKLQTSDQVRNLVHNYVFSSTDLYTFFSMRINIPIISYRISWKGWHGDSTSNIHAHLLVYLEHCWAVDDNYLSTDRPTTTTLVVRVQLGYHAQKPWSNARMNGPWHPHHSLSPIKLSRHVISTRLQYSNVLFPSLFCRFCSQSHTFQIPDTMRYDVPEQSN